MSNEQKFIPTPGEWVACWTDPFELPCKTGKPIVVGVEQSDGAVALVAVMTAHGEPNQASIDTMQANARLCAAAPEMLDVCRKFVQWIRDDEAHFYALPDSLIEAANAAIAKVEGGASAA